MASTSSRTGVTPTVALAFQHNMLLAITSVPEAGARNSFWCGLFPQRLPDSPFYTAN